LDFPVVGNVRGFGVVGNVRGFGAVGKVVGGIVRGIMSNIANLGGLSELLGISACELSPISKLTNEGG